MFWTSDASDQASGNKYYIIWGKKAGKFELRDLWPPELFAKWDKLKDGSSADRTLLQHFFRNASKAMASIVGGDLFVVSKPVTNPKEKGWNWSANDEYWEVYELGTLKERMKKPNADGLTSLTRVNIDEKGKEVYREVLWKVGDTI